MRDEKVILDQLVHNEDSSNVFFETFSVGTPFVRNRYLKVIKRL